MYSKILIAVDLSSEFTAVLKAGKALADALHIPAHAIYCMEPPIMPFGEIAALPIMPDFSQLKDELLPYFTEQAASVGINAELISIEIGYPTDRILAVAKSIEADLIIVGSHGYHGLRLLLGSTSNGILHHAACDILAIRIHP